MRASSDIDVTAAEREEEEAQVAGKRWQVEEERFQVLRRISRPILPSCHLAKYGHSLAFCTMTNICALYCFGEGVIISCPAQVMVYVRAFYMF